jgi:hypothetical protein
MLYVVVALDPGSLEAVWSSPVPESSVPLMIERIRAGLPDALYRVDEYRHGRHER